ncbi:MAG TPA: hypothetical protein VME63_06455 [Dyella sp.]|uniref:hypothetical protein n=1 Tax=Dyella sp. TaxID=1869338 RepID=UPI002BCEC6AD|nr:hypothetical protein [Dyella sp.]HTV85025.1 hypothetical protein [Dyella sp.]
MPDTPIDKSVILLVLVLLATIVLAMPALRYICTGWEARRADIMDALSPKSRLCYFDMFDRNQNLDENQAHAELDRFYIRWYGRRLYLIPVALLLATTLIVTYLVISSALALYDGGSLSASGAVTRGRFADLAWIPVPQLGLAAQAGAYMWVVNDFTSRARRLDFAPSDVHWGVLRLAIALPLGCFVAQVIPDAFSGWRSFVAFGVGAFPLSGLLSIFRRMLLTRLGIKDDVTTDNDIIKLQGINAGIAERLANEGITTIAQLAYCDPIRITMRSSLSFNFVIDCMNQALAWVYLEGGMNAIRAFGLRGAVEISHLQSSLESGDAGDVAEAEAVLACAARATRQDRATLRLVFYEIARDPFTEYLSTIWEGPER